ncbi:MAG: diaminopimelate epimerase [Vulcanibacillus sp.]
MEFTKIHGIGNDFVVLAQYKELPDKVAELARRICDRNFGVGADGMLFVLPSEIADVRMRIINADGTEPEQCGNGIRCVAKYAFDHGLVTNETIRVETQAGVKEVTVFLDEAKGDVALVRVDMGKPILQGNLVPTLINEEKVINHPIKIDDQIFYFTAVSMGNPHAIIYVEDAVNFDIEKWGPMIEKNSLFPRKTNVEFITVKSNNELIMRVWERGVGQTLACGTGACATAVASVLVGKSSRDVLVHLKGGDLNIVWDEKDNRVYMTGEAKEVFKGEWIE